MTHIFRLLLLTLLTALLAAPATAKARADHYGVMTYNIRLDLASDGDNAWPHRRKALTGLIAYYAPDLLGMQEVLLRQKQDIEADLPGYTFIGVARDDGKDQGEYSSLGFRRDRFTLLASGTFWLSPTPETPGKGWDAAYPRIVSWARLRDRKAKRTLLVANTHFDHVGTTARLESARQIRRWLGTHQTNGDSVILMGDFNSPTGDAPYAAITAAAPDLITLRDTLDISRTPHFGPPGTFTGFNIAQVQEKPIDHIFVGNGVTVLRHATLTQQTGGRLPSDHYPVLADLCIGKGC